MGLFGGKKMCDVCMEEKSGVSKHRNGFNICNDCKTSALSLLSKAEYNEANSCDLLYITKGSHKNVIKYCEFPGVSLSEKLKAFLEDPRYLTLRLKRGEICLYSGKAYLVKEKNIITSYQHYGSGISTSLMKGLSVKNYSSTTIPIRNNVIERKIGDLFITNQRITFLSSKKGYDIDYNSINGFERLKDGFRLYYKDKCYTTMTYDMEAISYALKLISEWAKTGEQVDLSDNKKTYSPDEIEKIVNDYYDEAKKFIAQLGKASISLIDRKFNIGEEAATVIIQRLEEEGAIGKANGLKPREVYIK